MSISVNKKLLCFFWAFISLVFYTSDLAFADPIAPKNSLVEAAILWRLKESPVKEKTGRAMKICQGIEQAKTAKKVVALTFDDGPHPKHTREILEILKQHDIRATFFVIGKNAQRHPDVIKEADTDGNIISNHSYSHFYLTTLSSDDIETELQKTNNLIYKTIQKYPTFFRPPYGACSDKSTQIVDRLGFTTITWNVMTDDYSSRQTSERIAAYVIKHAKPGAIIGLHDGGGNREKTVGALPIIIKALKDEGYKFLTIPELLNIKAYRDDDVGKKLG
ncbi:MAG: polysaccharide deacetylase [uncultured bacterium]|nr:MAG: polysaccharide deacetylase [uncultured bacterium]